MDSFGASGNGDALYKHYGFSPENISAKGKALVEFYKTNSPVPNLRNVPNFPNVTTSH
jgi:hypothetical protein